MWSFVPLPVVSKSIATKSLQKEEGIAVTVGAGLMDGRELVEGIEDGKPEMDGTGVVDGADEETSSRQTETDETAPEDCI